MSSLMRIRPTKIELIRLKNRLSISARVQKILSERLTILINEYLTSIKEAIEKRAIVQKQIQSVYHKAAIELGIYGPRLGVYLKEATPKPKIYTGTENIIGVKIKTVILKYDQELAEANPGIAEFVKYSRELLQNLIDLAKLEHAILELGREISATKRRTNALQYIVIPRLRMSIKTLQLKFDEREREEKARLKRVKQVINRRSVLWMS
ncbi:MAG: V-type ATP synthase subunit D [Desulfurococcaceae archaeon]